MKMGEAMYKAQADAAAQTGGGGPQAGGTAGGPDDKVVDAEFEEVDDKKSA